MSGNEAEIAIEAPLTSNPLDVIPDEIPLQCALWPPNITRASPGGDSSSRGIGQEAGLENEHSSSRFRR
jgi:hypothetical protein